MVRRKYPGFVESEAYTIGEEVGVKVRGREGPLKEENTKLQIWTLERFPWKGGDQKNLSRMLPVSCELFNQSSWHMRWWHRAWCGSSKTL